MSPSRPFILRPVATTLLMVGVLLVGWVAFRQLPISALPQVDYPTIQVQTFYPGASPEVMASSVTAPLERQFGQTPGLNQMTSTSSFGSSMITLQFDLDLNIDVAEQQVQAAINSAPNLLPQGLPNPPIYSKINPADAPILTLALTSKSLPLSKVEDLADTTLAQKISQLSGVGLVSISGGQRPAVRIQANPTALASYGLSLEDLRTALGQANVDMAKGTFDGLHQAYTIGANDQLISSDGYRPLIIAYRNGAPVRLTDVATVVDGVENTRQAAWANQNPAVILNIQRQPGTNIIAVVDRVKKLLGQLQAALPAAVHVQILTDRTTTIRASVDDVQFTLVLTVALVVMVIFLFLRSFRAVTILVSAFVSLTLTPMMCAKLLRHQKKEEESWFYRKSEDAFNAIIAFYGRTLQFVLRFRTTTLVVTVATLVGTILLYIYVPKGFFPVQDTGVILGVSEGPQNVSFAAMARRQQALADVILKDPAVESLSSFIGIDGTNTTLNNGRIQINLKPLAERKISASDVIRRLQSELAKVDGVSLFLQPVQDLTVEDRVSRTQFQYSLEDVDSKELAYWTPRFIDKLKSLPELRDVASDQLNQGLLASLIIDRDTASRLGILPADIDNTLYDSFGQRQVSTIFTQLNQYHVVMEVDPQFQQDPDSLKNIYVKSSNGTQVPLSTFTRFDPGDSALALNHQGQFPVVTLSFNLAPNGALGDAVNAINRAKQELNMPPSVQATFQGTAAAFLKSLANEPILILAALVTVYIVLGILYESYIHPITILSTLPSAGVGAILALLLCRTEFSVIALIGIILLIGIVKKNAIMMIDFALEAERREGKAPLDAIYEACLLRFRPIMMTTMAALLGGLPLALGAGVGSELRRPLGITIVGGLLLSQLLTLYTTPVVYLAFDWIARRLHLQIGNPVEEPSPAE